MVRKVIRRVLSKIVVEMIPDISYPESKLEYIDRDTLIVDALTSSEMAPLIFKKRRLPACHLCPLRMKETLGEAAKNYGIDEESWVIELNYSIFCRLQEMSQES